MDCLGRTMVFVACLVLLSTPACTETITLATETDADADADSDADGDADADDSDADGDVEADDVDCEEGDCRICGDPSYDLWASQMCGADGIWGACEEGIAVPSDVPDGWYSPADVQYCVDHEYCCRDMWDLDDDGDTHESLGFCDGAAGCEPGI